MTFNIRNVLAIIIISCSFALLGLLMFKTIPPSNKDIVNICIGVVMGSSITGVLGYYFADSKKEPNTTEISKTIDNN